MCDVGCGDNVMTNHADAQEQVYLLPRAYFVKVYWTPVCMVAKQLRSWCFKHAVRCSSRRVCWRQTYRLKFEIAVVRHKSSIQNDNYQCWRTWSCLNNAQTMFHRNSLDATKHGCKLTTQTMPHKSSQVFQPTGQLPASTHLKTKQAHTKTQPKLLMLYPQVSTYKTHGHPRALMQATTKHLASPNAGRHPISTP